MVCGLTSVRKKVRVAISCHCSNYKQSLLQFMQKYDVPSHACTRFQHEIILTHVISYFIILPDTLLIPEAKYAFLLNTNPKRYALLLIQCVIVKAKFWDNCGHKKNIADEDIAFLSDFACAVLIEFSIYYIIFYFWFKWMEICFLTLELNNR